jgi:hypothetical protein
MFDLDPKDQLARMRDIGKVPTGTMLILNPTCFHGGVGKRDQETERTVFFTTASMHGEVPDNYDLQINPFAVSIYLCFFICVLVNHVIYYLLFIIYSMHT